jgi:hypothetical protein
MRVDEHGNIWSSAVDGVHCISAGGELLGRIFVPHRVSNMTFGGPAKNRQWERVGEVAARVEYWQRPTVRSALWRLMKEGHIDAEQRFLQSGHGHRMQMGYCWVFRRKSSSP